MPQVIKFSPTTTLLKSDPALPITASWFDPTFWLSQNALTGTGNGRGEVWFIDGKFGNFVLRRYRRGGLIAKFNKCRFLFTGQTQTRPFLEISLLEKMNSLSLPVPKPVGALYRVTFGFYQAELLTETIQNAQDLFDIIKGQHTNKIRWNEIGAVIKRFHDNGIYHSDLNCHNIMIDQDNKIWLIDFDKCEQRPQDKKWQQANIDRLKRSLDKESKLHTQFNISDAQWRDFMEGYRG